LQLYGPNFALLVAQARRGVATQALREHRLLLVLDNFESVASMPDSTQATPPLDQEGQEELRGFLGELSRLGSKSAVLVTSRTEEAWLGELRRILLGGLRPEEAAEYADDLLAPYPAARARRASPAFADLLEWLDGHPLALRIILPYLEHTSPEQLLAALKGQAQLPPEFEVETDAGRTASLRASVQYSLAHLDAQTHRLLPAVALFEGVADLNVLANLSEDEYAPARFRGVSFDHWEAVLDAAAGVGLLSKLGSMYRVHPALPAYLTAAWRAQDPDGYPEERTAARRALVAPFAGLADWLNRQIQQGDAATALTVIDLQRRSLGMVLAAALDAKRYGEAHSIFLPLTDYWGRRGLTQEAMAWVDRCRARLEAVDGTPPALGTPGGELWLFAVSHNASLHLNTGDVDAAQATYEVIRTSVEAQPESETRRRRLAFTYHHLGVVAQMRGELDRAESWYRQALAVSEQLGDRLETAGTYHQLGMIARRRGELDHAESWHRHALAVLEQLGDRPHMAGTYHELGTVAQFRGELGQAEGWYRQALVIFEQLGDRPKMALTSHQLGMIAELSGELGQAEGWYRQALVIFEQLGDRPHMAGTYHQLGMIAELRGELDHAESWYRQALAVFEELGDPNMAHTYHQLGMIAQARGELDHAESWYRRSLNVFEQLGDRPYSADAYRQLGVVAELRGELDHAESWYRRALAVFEQLGDRPHMAQIYGQLGLLAEAKQQPAVALEFVVRCVTVFDQFPHPSTGPGPQHLMLLTRQLGIRALEEAWWKVTATVLPRAVRAHIERTFE
jgi:tetratricopeptide (TPR) repeat protein